MRNWRRHIILAFGLVFVLSGMANAYARAYMTGAHSIEICAALGNTEVTLGANGEPLPELHNCESCCIAVGVLSAPPAYIARENRADLADLTGFELALNPAFPTLSMWPRGPPVSG